MFNAIIMAIPNVIGALLLLLLAWVVAVVVKGIFTKLLTKLGAARGLSKARLVKTEEQGKDVLQSIGKILYFLVFILFLPSIVDALNMQTVAQPISNMVEVFLAFLPNVFAAAVIIIVGWFIARFVRDLVRNLLQSANIDGWFNRITKADQSEEAGTKDKQNLANILSNIVLIVILIPIITIALETLNIDTITEPIVSVLNTVLNIIPNIFVAIILLLAGYYLAKFVSELLTSLLQRTGINSVYDYLGWDRRPAADSKFDLASILGQITKVIIILFFTVEALNVLQLDVLNQIGNAIIVYLPMLISALIILGLGLFGGNLIQNVMKKYTNSSFSAAIVKYIIIIFAVFMTLDQLGFASTIVNIGFLLILGGLSVAFAISFGIGGREFAKRNLDKFERKMERDTNHSEPENKNDNDINGPTP
ncbi:mechanosensitive ion channel [Bacillus sp. FJAT-44742]|uniref:mechanosensitive ion channel n=1 Tax=Bacillus sp. FJAT-44742 TaxID=2014005 RepID=UPI000C24B218|nr:mechanosensitive ion channel [Bacillus sp. FJAT-44742]